MEGHAADAQQFGRGPNLSAKETSRPPGWAATGGPLQALRTEASTDRPPLLILTGLLRTRHHSLAGAITVKCVKSDFTLLGVLAPQNSSCFTRLRAQSARRSTTHADRRGSSALQ